MGINGKNNLEVIPANAKQNGKQHILILELKTHNFSAVNDLISNRSIEANKIFGKMSSESINRENYQIHHQEERGMLKNNSNMTGGKPLNSSFRSC